jgi:hypothetical protein
MLNFFFHVLQSLMPCQCAILYKSVVARLVVRGAQRNESQPLWDRSVSLVCHILVGFSFGYTRVTESNVAVAPVKLFIFPFGYIGCNRMACAPECSKT